MHSADIFASKLPRKLNLCVGTAAAIVDVAEEDMHPISMLDCFQNVSQQSPTRPIVASSGPMAEFSSMRSCIILQFEGQK